MTILIKPPISDWATADSTQVIEPTDKKKRQGWAPGEKPLSQHFNWWMQLASKWMSYVSALAGSASPLPDGPNALPGSSDCFAREDHVHKATTTPGTTPPLPDGPSALPGSSATVSRADHVHPESVLPANKIPIQDGPSALLGSSARFAREDHVHPAVPRSRSPLPIFDAVGQDRIYALPGGPIELGPYGIKTQTISGATDNTFETGEALGRFTAAGIYGGWVEVDFENNGPGCGGGFRWMYQGDTLVQMISGSPDNPYHDGLNFDVTTGNAVDFTLRQPGGRIRFGTSPLVKESTPAIWFQPDDGSAFFAGAVSVNTAPTAATHVVRKAELTALTSSSDAQAQRIATLETQLAALLTRVAALETATSGGAF